MSSNDYTQFPEFIDNGLDYAKWKFWDNTEFRAEENAAESWQGVDNLQKAFPKKSVYLININSGPIIRELKQQEKATFAFDYAVSNISEDTKLWLEYWINKHRNCKVDDNRTKLGFYARCMLNLDKIEDIVSSVPHCESHFS